MCVQRILHVDYHIPPHVRVSDECKDLLARILVADPAKRITIAGIYNHKWYLKGLPPGVREMNDRAQPPPEGLQVRGADGVGRGRWRKRWWGGVVRGQVPLLEVLQRTCLGDFRVCVCPPPSGPVALLQLLQQRVTI